MKRKPLSIAAWSAVLVLVIGLGVGVWEEFSFRQALGRWMGEYEVALAQFDQLISLPSGQAADPVQAMDVQLQAVKAVGVEVRRYQPPAFVGIWYDGFLGDEVRLYDEFANKYAEG